MYLNAHYAALAVTVLLASCAAPPPLQHPHGRADVVLATESGMGTLVVEGDYSFLALANSATRASAVLHTGGAISSASLWRPLDLGPCALAPARTGQAPRQPALAWLAGKLYLHQRTMALGEHALCQLQRADAAMVPRDEGLTVCRERTCARLWMTDLQWHGQALLSNAGGGDNVLALAPGAHIWRSLVGRLGTQACPHAAFAVSGQRLLAGGQCAPGVSWLRAWQLPQRAAQPLAPPPLERRAIHFIAPLAAGGTVFAGVTGGLLKSTDAGQSFRFVIHHAQGTAAMPEIRHLLALGRRQQVLLAAGEDGLQKRPYLAVSRDGGERWTDLSSILPAQDGGQASVTGLAQDRQGRILASLNLQPQGQGRLLLLTLGGVD